VTTRAQGVIARWADRLALPRDAPRISLGEGDTPCVESLTIGPSLGLASLHFKLEGLNPTGSFKDRGMVVAVAAALHEGSRAIICASTGNTSASAAAYGARFGLRTVVVVPQGHIASGKLVQARVHGATVVSIRAGFDVALRLVRELCERRPVTLVNSVNPNRIDGQKTAAFEIVDELGDAPDLVALPVGNAGNITAYWRGFREDHLAGRASRLPRMFGGQASGAAPLVLGRPVDDPQTVATAIRIGNPASWQGAIDARDESEGMIAAVDDEVILDAQRRLAQLEGIFCEPASAAALAVLERAIAEGSVARGTRAVCVLTGNGLKDPGAVEAALAPILEIPSDASALARAIGV
jgi:threonine synthase